MIRRRVLIVATSPVVRAGLSAVITASPELTVIGMTSSWDDTTELQLQADVVLMDLSGNVPVWEEQYLLPVIIIIDVESINLEAALRAGVRGILPQTSTEAEIIAAVEGVAAGLVTLHPDVVEYLLSMKSSVPDVVSAIQMTPREVEVLRMLGSGLGNKAIAKGLQISEHTVKFHISSIFQKLSVSSRTEAVAVGVRLGLIML